LALRASFSNAANVSDPLLLTDEHLLGGLRIYQDNCAKCQGMPGRPAPLISKGMFPPPQLFEKGEMVADDPEGITYWKVTHGIRLSGKLAIELG
jgi:hypothetical protein